MYAAFSDNHRVYFAASTDGGKTWSKAVKANGSPVATAIFPWLEAGTAGRVDLVYYGTAFSNGAKSRYSANMPSMKS